MGRLLSLLGIDGPMFPRLPDAEDGNLTVFGVKKIEQVSQILDNTDFELYADKAQEKLKELDVNVEDAIRDYKDHLMLCLVNKMQGANNFIVPSEQADAIWHEYILNTREYMDFCDTVFGEYLHHNPGLEKGSPQFNKAVEHTEDMKKKTGVPSKDNGNQGAACGGGGVVGDSSHSSCGGASCGVGCGAGCGG